MADFLTDLAVSDLDNLEELFTSNLNDVACGQRAGISSGAFNGQKKGFSHYRAMLEESELEEERRLAYVGITRAEEALFLTNAYSRTLYGRTQYNRPSRF